MKKETKISVFLSDDEEKVRKVFRCVNCGKIVFEHYGNVKLLIDGGNEVKTPYVIQCKGKREGFDIISGRYSEQCNTKYVIS